MTQSRPNYVLKLADGSERVFTPSQPGTWSMRQSTRLFSENELSTLGAAPVPQEELARYRMFFGEDRELGGNGTDSYMEFKSHEDAENYRRRCESIGPEWTDWEPKEEDQCWYIGQTCDIVTTGYIASVFGDDLLRGRLHPTKERAQEWLDRFGKAWGLM